MTWQGESFRSEFATFPSIRKVYPVIFVDALVVKVPEGQVRNTPFHVVMGVTTAGGRDILGIWAGAEGGEGARFWPQVFTELKNRGVEDVLIAVCDGLKGLPEAITATWEHTIVQQCILHLIRASFRYAGRQRRDAIVKSLKPVYTAPSEAAAQDRFAEFAAEWGQRHPAIVRLWESSWAEFVPFLEYDVEVRRVIATTNAIESINARHRRAVKARGHFPTQAAALKCLYLVTRSLDPTGGGRARWVTRWKPALNAFAITFADRLDRAIN
jgi:putative transposase